MEFVTITFPSLRTVNVDGAPQGPTGKVLRLQAGTHRFDLGAPRNYAPASQTIQVVGTTSAHPLQVAFTARTPARAGAPKRKTRPRGTTAPRSRRTPTPATSARARKSTKRGQAVEPKARARAKAPAAGDPDEPITQHIVLRTPTKAFSFNPSADPERGPREFQRAAMQWTYVVRNRERWSGLPPSAKKQADRAGELLKRLGLPETAIETIAADRLVEVAIPFRIEADGWEARIFPWEFILAGATREARRGEALTVVRRLVVPGTRPQPRSPVKVLYVESAPGKLRDVYSFDTERTLVQSNLRATGGHWQMLLTPTLEELQATVETFRPDIIHLAGFDSHHGRRLLRPTAGQRNGEGRAREGEAEADRTADGYVLATSAGQPRFVDGETLAGALCAKGHRPRLVAFSLQNSAARVAPMAVAKGAHAAIGFQDAFDDNLAELFYSSFYRAWRKGDWQLTDGFRDAWETVRSQPSSVLGSGLVLWSAHPLLEAPRRRARAGTTKPSTPKRPHIWMPGRVPADDTAQVIAADVEPLKELNYSLLHNRCPLFKHFKLLNKTATYKNTDDLVTLADVDVQVTLSAGTESATYQRRLALEIANIDLSLSIHVPLTSELLRSLHESINSSLLVEVSWGHLIYRNSHSVRLLPIDQWRDNDRDGQWLPSFVLPRDSAVTALVEKAQRYVRVLRDDPSAGFDGYQSLDPQAADPAAEVDRQVQALWSAIVHEWDLGYINPPPTYSNEMDSQRLRTPSMIVKGRSGTCIDLALLMAACCELIDVYPVIFLLKDHAFPGYWRSDELHQQFIEIAGEFVEEVALEQQAQAAAPGAQPVSWWFRETAFKEIARQVKLGNLVPLESVWLTEHSGFWEAVDGGRDNLKKASRFHSMLDIARAREAGVTPLPVGGRS